MSDFRCHLLWHSAYLYFHLILSLSDRSYSLHLGKFIRSSEKKWSLNKIQIRINKLYMVLIEKKVFRWKRIYGIFFILLSILWTSLKPWGICQYLWFWQNVLQIHIHIYPAAGWERVEVKQLYSVHVFTVIIKSSFWNYTIKPQNKCSLSNTRTYLNTFFLKGGSCDKPALVLVPVFAFRTMFRNFVLIWSAEGLNSADVKSLAISFRYFFSFFSRNSFTKTSLC